MSTGPAAGDKDVVVFGATTARHCIAEGLLDELLIHVVPVLLGDGIRLFGGPGIERVPLELTNVVQSGQQVDLRYRVVK